jgi:hypothetical protein
VPLRKRDELSTAQDAAIDELKRRRRANLWAKPGSGKTVVAATAVTDLFEGPTLVTATKRIAELVWRQELEQWEHLAHLDAVLLFGTPKVRERLLSSTADFYLINYELLPWLADTLRGAPWPFSSIIFDEVSKLKWPGTRRFKKLRDPVQSVPVRIGLTGTPRGNSILGVWGQFFVTNATPSEGAPLAPTMGRFKARWAYPVDRDRRVWRPLSGAEEEIRSLSPPYAYSMPRSTAAPEAKVVPVPVSVPASVRRLYQALEADLTVTIGEHQIDAIEPAANRNKRLQLCSGAIYTAPDRSEWVEVHDAKIEALREIVEEMQGDPLLVFYRFRHEFERARRVIPDLLDINSAEEWLREGGTLAVHPESAAHGLNLHVGGCCRSVWITLPDSQELWEQGNRRLARKGQTEEVVALVLAIQNTIEDTIARNLATHGRLQDELIDEAA